MGEKEVGPSEPQHEEGMAQILLALWLRVHFPPDCWLEEIFGDR